MNTTVRPGVVSFDARNKADADPAIRDRAEHFLLDYFSPEAIRIAWVTDERAQKCGVDARVLFKDSGRPPICVDRKVRKEVHRQKGLDVALETVSSDRSGAVGWTLDPEKWTDYVLWQWDDEKAGVRDELIVPYWPLHRLFLARMNDYLEEYEDAQQNSGTHKSRCVFVPLARLWLDGLAHVGLSANWARNVRADVRGLLVPQESINIQRVRVAELSWLGGRLGTLLDIAQIADKLKIPLADIRDKLDRCLKESDAQA